MRYCIRSKLYSQSRKVLLSAGEYWSGVANVDIVNNTALHLKTLQTPPAVELAEKGMTLLSYYASLVAENAASFKEYSNYILADAYFDKRPFVDAVLSTGMHFISRLGMTAY